MEKLNQEIFQKHLHSFQNADDLWSKKKELPPTLLFHGPRGIGKKTFLKFYAKKILCENSAFHESMFPRETNAPCGECSTCRRIDSNQFPDLVEIQKEENGNYKLDTFREILESQGKPPHEGVYKIYLLSDLEILNTSSANACLKILEEPPKNWVFMMSTSEVGKVIPTILSRCQKINLHSLPAHLLHSLQPHLSEEKANQIASFCSGRIDLFLLFSEEENQFLLEEIESLLFSKKPSFSMLQKYFLESEKNAEIVLHLLETKTHQALLHDPNPKKRMEQLDQVNEIRKLIRLPMQKKIIAQNLWMSYLS